MLVESLRSHPEIVGFGELFAPRRITFNVEGYDNQSMRLLALRNRYPVDFLERFVFSGYQREIKAVGFKVFLHQLDNPTFLPVWDWIQRNDRAKILLLLRRNLLAAYTSLLIANKDNRFGIKGGKRIQKSD